MQKKEKNLSLPSPSELQGSSAITKQMVAINRKLFRYQTSKD